MAIATGLTALFFIMDFLAQLWSPPRRMGPLSIFHYYDAVAIASGTGLPVRDLVILGAVAVAGWGAALWVFQRRDIA